MANTTRRTVTITDVAEAAGVSVATVSRVMNNRYGVAAKTVEHVRTVIEELGYEGSLVARSMRSRRTNVIGVIIMDLEPFSTELLKGAARAIHASEYDLIVYSAGGHTTYEHPGWERRLVARLNGSLTDGTILVTPTVMEITTDSPIVAIDPHIGAKGLPAIASNNYDGARIAMDHLTKLGHQRIGFIGGRPDLESAQRRHAGYVDGLESAGLALDETLVRIGDYTREVALTCATDLLDLPEPPTAIFAANDESAIAALLAARERGLRVPDELSVIGFDNLPEAALTDPPLTTVDQSVQQMGYEATKLLFAQIEDPTRAPVQLTLPTELVERASTRAVSLD
ncbi:LacI family DNA-binding transcriptional regulator [Egicoccus halophilus]|uniref:LacI family transcriptional regulator n=1 Tax=Egicoccus halophilus TaxID=1670830 RepID=A0A8J3ADB7_9ACTN|nr:LacI family DNA-binding transcriptional regulator [Egicoccus halophilus]GGI09443.1 LacI family transcriptional regulator [Egicoccus halophilus]